LNRVQPECNQSYETEKIREKLEKGKRKLTAEIEVLFI
jgi:hypothetical protein